MGFKVLYDFKNIGFLIIGAMVVFVGCKSSENLPEESSNQSPIEQRRAIPSSSDGGSNETSSDSNPGAVIVTYKNQSSNIQITLDPTKDEFYLDLSGMAPQDKDSVVVQDSSLIKNRALDIQSLLASYRKAQDLFYLGEYNNALEEVDKTLLIQETADAYALKGTIFFMLENVIAARANWNRAVQMDPNIPVPSIPELETLIDEIRGENN